MDLDDGLRAFLQQVFACSTAVADAIGARAHDRRYPQRAVILRQGDEGGETFLLILGRAHALLYGVEGQLVLLQEFGPGDMFGAIVQSPSQPHDADVVAVEEVHSAMFLAVDFLSLVEAHSCMGLALSRILLRQLRAASERMANRAILSATGRIHAELLRLARSGDGSTIRPAPVLAAFAVTVNSTRETVSRTINALERRGVIRREPGALVIVAPHRLEEDLA